MSNESRALILRLAVRAIRWRTAASATVFVVAVVAVLAATVGPIYLPAVNETVLVRHLKDAIPLQRDVLVSRQSELGYPGVNWPRQVGILADDVSRDHLFGLPTAERQINVRFGAREPVKSEVAYVENLCAHLQIVRGHCLSGDSNNDTLISAKTAAAEHLAVGDVLTAVSQATATTGAVSIPLRIVGIYSPLAPGGAFWSPWYLFQFGQPAVPNQLPPGDASFVTRAALASRLHRVTERLSENVALLPDRVRYDEVGELRKTIARVNADDARFVHAAGSTGIPVSTVTTSLPLLLDQTAKETSLARTLVIIATAQLALLALFLLYAVVANMTAVQGPEVALAKLRGRRPVSVLLQSVAQPVVLVLAAAPVGALLALDPRPLVRGSAAQASR